MIISYLFFFLEAAYGSPDMIASLFKQLLDEVGSDETRGTCHEDDGYAILRLFLAHTILKLLFRSRHYCQILLFPENISVYAIVPERIMANNGTSFCLYRHNRNVSMSYAPLLDMHAPALTGIPSRASDAFHYTHAQYSFIHNVWNLAHAHNKLH